MALRSTSQLRGEYEGMCRQGCGMRHVEWPDMESGAGGSKGESSVAHRKGSVAGDSASFSSCRLSMQVCTRKGRISITTRLVERWVSLARRVSPKGNPPRTGSLHGLHWEATWTCGLAAHCASLLASRSMMFCVIRRDSSLIQWYHQWLSMMFLRRSQLWPQPTDMVLHRRFGGPGRLWVSIRGHCWSARPRGTVAIELRGTWPDGTSAATAGVLPSCASHIPLETPEDPHVPAVRVRWI